MFKFAVICSVMVLSSGLALKAPDEDIKSYYKVEKIERSKEPLIVRHFNIKNKNSKVLRYEIVSPNNNMEDYDVSDGKEYVIIKSEKEAFDVIPYGLVQHLDKIKYMVLWLNLYCEMHPDCDKSVLDEELRKVSAYSLACVLQNGGRTIKFLFNIFVPTKLIIIQLYFDTHQTFNINNPNCFKSKDIL